MHYLNIVLYKAYAELKAEAARRYLGVLWWLFEPLLFLGVFYFVFGYVFDRGGIDYVLFLLSGLIAFKWFASAVSIGSASLLGNVPLMRQVYLPKYIFPMVPVITTMTKFVLVLALFLAFLVLVGVEPTAYWLLVPVIVLVQMLFIAACVGVLSAIIPFVPDLRLLIESGITLMMFLSGIFFDIGAMDAEAQSILMLNPLANIIDAYRDILIYENAPDIAGISIVVLESLIMLVVAVAILVRFDRLYPKIMQ